MRSVILDGSIKYSESSQSEWLLLRSKRPLSWKVVTVRMHRPVRSPHAFDGVHRASSVISHDGPARGAAEKSGGAEQ